MLHNRCIARISCADQTRMTDVSLTIREICGIYCAPIMLPPYFPQDLYTTELKQPAKPLSLQFI